MIKDSRESFCPKSGARAEAVWTLSTNAEIVRDAIDNKLLHQSGRYRSLETSASS
jgi:hypothetical protein